MLPYGAARTATKAQHRETLRGKAKEALRVHKGKSATMQLKRRSVEVKVTKDTIDHLSNAIANGHIDIPIEKFAELLKWISESTPADNSATDTTGKHAKDNKKTPAFYYNSFAMDGKNYYLNVKAHKIRNETRTKGGKVRITYAQEYVLYDITKKIRNNNR